jgi:hypothetical protein
MWSHERNSGNKRRILCVGGQQDQVQEQAQDGTGVVAPSRRVVAANGHAKSFASFFFLTSM